MALALKVAKKDAQSALEALRQKGALDSRHEVGHEDGFVYLPIRSSGQAFAAGLGLGEVVKKTLAAARKRPRSLHDELAGVLAPDELERLLSSFDVLGDIAMLEIPPRLEGRQKEIAQAIMKLYPHVRTVVKKEEGTSGPYRIRPVGVVAGENRTRTVSRENGCSFSVDLNQAYYNPRMANERMRIVEQIKENENVLVLFAGVGPYAILAEKKAKPAQIVAVELNPAAVAMMKENIKLNKCKKIEVLEGDVEQVLAQPRFRTWAGRIVMPHPTEAMRFLPAALGAAKTGAIIHLYAFGASEEPLPALLSEAQEIAHKFGFSLVLKSWRVAQTYSPALVQIVMDLQKN